MIQQADGLKVAVIDVGSNTSKILISQFDQNGSLTPTLEKSFPCRLISSESQKLGVILPDQLKQLLAVLEQLVSISKEESTDHLTLVATEAIRRSTNQEEIKTVIEEKFAHKLHVVSGQQEAELIADGVRFDPLIKGETHLQVFDLGGGSLEIIESMDGHSTFAKSVPLGALALAERLNVSSENPLSLPVVEELNDYLLSEISKVGLTNGNTAKLIGLGGAIFFIRKILAEQRGEEFEDCNQFTLEEIADLTEASCGMSMTERISAFPDLPSDRADVFPLVCLVVKQLMQVAGKEHFYHSFCNLRYGVASNIAKFKDSAGCSFD
jgi:exopolyphosphatase/guanosine-5'-triphosphate,3'-diphosphate pyrophosphatase